MIDKIIIEMLKGGEESVQLGLQIAYEKCPELYLLFHTSHLPKDNNSSSWPSAGISVPIISYIDLLENICENYISLGQMVRYKGLDNSYS